MRTCPKCGSYLPDGKVLCPACGRVNIGIAKTAHDNVRAEKGRTYGRIRDAHSEVKRDAWLKPKEQNPYQGHTYEQHKSHDPRSKDYYKPKYDTGTPTMSAAGQRLICAAAYFGVFFFLPLVLMPDSQEGKFHANQGLTLFICNVLFGVFAGVVSSIFGDFFEIIAAIPPMLMVYGAANAYRGNMMELPLIGKIHLLDEIDKFGGRR